MQLLIFASAWSFGSIERCLQVLEHGPFDGVEGRCPATADRRRELRRSLERDHVPFIAEICTGGDYAPRSSVAVEQHLRDFETQLGHASECGALMANCLLGSDSWSVAQAVDCFGRALELAAGAPLKLSFETHRGRPTFHPNTTLALLDALPALGLTCDLSHWCVVCERLLDRPTVLDAVAQRARHVHARVGYAQGPQVPDPRASGYLAELEAHEVWWDTIWLAARARGVTLFPTTPEFGPDGYLQSHPYSGQPVADLADLNTWMAQRLRRRFSDLMDHDAAVGL